MSQNNIEKIIKEISKEWFYSSPLFFNVLCSHSIVQNPNLSIPIRSGAMRIEYSPALLKGLSTKNIEALLQNEITRILLAHPYKRRPYNAKPGILYMASEAARIQAEYKTLDFLTAESANPTLEFLAQQIGPHATFEEMTFEKWYKYIYDLVKKAKGGSLQRGFISELYAPKNDKEFVETYKKYGSNMEIAWIADTMNNASLAEFDLPKEVIDAVKYKHDLFSAYYSEYKSKFDAFHQFGIQSGFRHRFPGK